MSDKQMALQTSNPPATTDNFLVAEKKVLSRRVNPPYVIRRGETIDPTG